jgi:hypothetical protein
MAEETLFTAARRVLRCIRIDEAHGGMLSIETMKAIETLDKEVRKQSTRSPPTNEAA